VAEEASVRVDSMNHPTAPTDVIAPETITALVRLSPWQHDQLASRSPAAGARARRTWVASLDNRRWPGA
ncbi:uncharacterized protein METZ01_LOCUS6543, partial [marine metagenome]